MRLPWCFFSAVVLSAMAASAAVVVQEFQGKTMSSTVLTNDYTVAVQAGDVVVMTAAGNKRDSVSPITFSSAAGTLSLVNTAATDPYPTAYSAYLAIGTSGTYDFRAVSGGSITAGTGLYVLRADAGTIVFLGSAEFVNEDGNNEADQTLVYDWGGTAITNGMVVEAVCSRSSLISSADMDVDWDGGKRLLTSTSFSGTGFDSTYSFAEGVADIMTSSGVGLAFAERSASPQPPVFETDPVVEINAVQDAAYSSTLADDAADPNGDPLTFWKAPDFSWLTVAANGDLSGTPLSGDVGSNAWTVFVTDGISGTNSAILEINVLAGPPEPQTSRTNIVFIVIDDLGWMDLSIQGSQFYETPRIDELATTGMRFVQGYTAHPRCLPSRYGLMTGRFPGANGVPGGWPENNLRPSEITVAEALRADGYATCFAGKWHLIGTHGEDNLPQNQGFDANFAGGKAGAPPTYFDPYRLAGTPAPTSELAADALYFEKEGVEGEYLTDRLTDETLDWMTWNAHKPMFVCLWHYGVHTPFEAPSNLVAKYEAKLATMDYGSLPEYIPAGVGEQKMRQDHPIYAAMIESIDTNVGRLMDRIEALGIASNTVVIFTSDNGGLSNRGGYSGRELATANFPLRTGKGWLYEGGIREAFIVSGAGVPPMVNSNAVVTGTDIYPTCLELAGLPLMPANHHDGVSFVDALRGLPYDRGKPIFWHSPLARPYSTGDFNSSAVRDGDYKLIWWYDTPGNNHELYNVKTDPGETMDLCETNPSKATELLGKIQAWHAGAHEGSGVVFKSDVDDVSKPPEGANAAGVRVFPDADSGSVGITWGDYLGFDYNIYGKTNLLDAAWVLEASGLTTNQTTFPLVGSERFYRLELELQPES